MLFNEINMNPNTYFVITRSLFNLMKLVIIFGIKICQNSPIYPTIQKSDYVYRLLVANFVVQLKQILLMVPITNVGMSSLYCG